LIASAHASSGAELRRFTLIWFLVLLIAILAIAGGLALSKFLFILLVVAVIVALVGARSTA
jgi:hypothetical protein